MRHLKAFGVLTFGVLVLVAAASAAAGGSLAGTDRFRVLPAQLSIDSSFVGAKSRSGELAQSDPSLLGRTDSTLVNVMIKYDYDPTASYAGGVAGLAPTSPAVTGKGLKDNKEAVQAYNRHTAAVSEKITSAVEKAVPDTTVRESFRTAYGGVEAQVPANQIADLLKVDGVAAVQKDALRQPLDDNTEFLGATNVWPLLGGSASAGSNVIIGVLDTGVWPEHPMLSPDGISAPAGGLKGCEFGDGSDAAHLGSPFDCNNKLIGAYAKTATYMAVVGAGANEFCNNSTHTCSPRDSEGHGTHTMTTAAGDRVDSAVLYGVERGPVSGIAPGAHVIEYRVCLASGCFSSDSVSAVQQAIADGVDVLNFSISGGAQPYSDPVELAFLDATNAGISVNASAGNSGPGSATSDHGGPWTTTVGASTGPREFRSTLHLTADGGATFDKVGITLTNGISSPAPVVLAESLPGEDVLCQTPLAPGTAAGKIVACKRGTNARVDKGYNVLQGGAVGMILYNPVKQDVESDNHWLPAIHLDGPNTDLLDFINNHTNVMATWVQGTALPGQADMMAAFSSRGPLGDWVKPDVTAPGVQVLAGMTPQPTGTANGPPGNLYQAIAGTSMSSPHSAGVSALVKAVHPDWTPAMIKSALMTSSVQSVVKEDGVTPATPFDMGAGRIQADRAINPTLVFNETYADFVAAGTDTLHRIDLNLASIDAPTMTGTITTMRTAINVSGKDQDLEVSTQAPDGAAIVVSGHKPGQHGPGSHGDAKLHVDKHKALRFWVTISAPELADGQYFGRITLDPEKAGYNAVTIPVAFNKRQGLVALTHICDPTTFAALTGRSHCEASVTNLASVEADVSLRVTNLDRGRGLDFTNISAPARAIRHDDGVSWHGTLTPALPPQVDSITSGSDADIGGYLPLSLFGVAKISAGDDTLTNFNVPAFKYGAETYTRLGVGSNGTLVIGGGASADATPFPQTFPDPARPNNVVAPFWTDLNPAAAGLPPSAGIRIAVLADSGVHKRWIVVDWAGVPNFGGDATHTFEVWIETVAMSDGTPTADGERISLEYDTTGPGDAGVGGANYGAENKDGTSGKNISPAPANGSQYTVNLSPPTPGGSATIAYDVSAKRAGTYRSVAGMTSNVTPGTTQVVQTFTVTSP